MAHWSRMIISESTKFFIAFEYLLMLLSILTLFIWTMFDFMTDCVLLPSPHPLFFQYSFVGVPSKLQFRFMISALMILFSFDRHC